MDDYWSLDSFSLRGEKCPLPLGNPEDLGINLSEQGDFRGKSFIVRCVMNIGAVKKGENKFSLKL